ncbi:MAG: beta-lactamase family protein [Proteobacteria bacterium]|nr:beta-lactamase family protein [Pseudomonadota bacterium]
MIRFAVFTTLLVTALAAPAAGAEALLDRDFDAEFRLTLEEAGIPGGAYAIVRDGHIVHAGGYGVRLSGSDDPVTADTVFRVASVSKTFAAQLTGMLVGEDKLHWDDSLNLFLPDFRFKPGDHATALQIRHLLGQSSGIVPNAYDNLLDADIPLDNILPRFSKLEPVCAPGLCYTYQNILFSLIDPVIEKATDLSYSALVQQRIFQPLHMQHASLGLEAFLATDDRALPHVKRNGAWIPTEVKKGYYQVAPAAGINASANDLGLWLLAQMGNRPDVVSPEVVAKLTEKHIRTPRDLRRRHWRDMGLTDAHYGMGWRIYQVGGEEIYLHSGWVNGYVADVAYSRTRRTGLVVLLNAESGVISEITTRFWKDVLDEPLEILHAESATGDDHDTAPINPSAPQPEREGTVKTMIEMGVAK